MSQPRSLTQLVLNVEFPTPTPGQPTKPLREVRASCGDFHSHVGLSQRWSQGHFPVIGLPIFKKVSGLPFSVEIFYLVPISRAQAEDSSHKFIRVQRIKHYIGKEASNTVLRFDQPAEILECRQKIWEKQRENYFNSEIQTVQNQQLTGRFIARIIF